MGGRTGSTGRGRGTLPPTLRPPLFSGKLGKRRLIECLKSQPLVGHDEALARDLAKSGVLHTFQDGDFLTQQDEPDNSIWLVVHGKVLIIVNGREVATRNAGTHVGELALVDHSAIRSASVRAVGHTVALNIPEHRFSRLADRSPSLWRRIAVEVANRLRERNRFLPAPRSQPVIFIGSSSEGLAVADSLYKSVERRQVVPRLWTEGVFEASSTTIESLVSLAHSVDFAALVLTADDVVASRSKTTLSPRDNVVFELGLMIGALGRDRVFILEPLTVNLRIPSDLLGVTFLRYNNRGSGTLSRQLTGPRTAILNKIKQLGPR